MTEAELERVADVATVQLRTSGWRELSISDVARAAEVPATALRDTVLDEEGLLTLVLETRDATDIESVRALRGASPLEPHEALHNLVAHNAEQPEIVRLYTVLAGEAIYPSHPAYSYFQRRYTESVEIMADIVDAIVPDPQATAVQIIAIMDGLQLQWLRDLDNFDLVAEWDKASKRILSA